MNQNLDPDKLAMKAASESFKLFTNPIFRQYCDFANITQTEQDRIFNELVIAILTVMMLTCDAPDISDERKDYLQDIKDKISQGYINSLKMMGVESKYLDQWRTLIDMRYREYSNDKGQAREAAMLVESEDRVIDLKKLSEIQMMLPLQTVAIGCHHHICRSKTDGRDDLFKMILRWLGDYYVEFRVLAEGKTIHPFARIKVGIRRLLRNLR